MKPEIFYAEFESTFSGIVAELPDLHRRKGKIPRWRIDHGNTSIEFQFPVNAKASGLLPYFPGEFKLRILWTQGTGHAKTTADISLFQYTNDTENRRFATLQRIPLEKYLVQPEAPYARSLFIYTDDPGWLPKPNCDEYCYYFDATDARAWGDWLRTLLPGWIERFLAAPESNEEWCWRVLWPHLPRRHS